MNTADRKLLEYLKNRAWIALQPILTECPGATEQQLQNLHKRGYVEFIKYTGSGNTDFFKLTIKGQQALLPFYTNITDYFIKNWIALTALIASIISVLIALLKQAG